ncbi:MAG: gamma-glutamylcyclotransferase [Candidatus Azotimanducaceae bacterium]|jgi:gamma-glutamylcyclotransferase
MTTKQHYYFAYGSNMNPDRVKRRGLDFSSVLAGTLEGFYLSFNKRSVAHVGAASANITKQPLLGSKRGPVEGVIYHLADKSQIELMDPFEGYPVRYDRILVDVQTLEGPKAVWTYTANKEYLAEGLKPNRWYLRHLLAGKPYLSQTYYQVLEETLCLPDSDVEPS